MPRLRWSIAFAVAFATVGGCSDAAGPSAETRAAAGIYVLQPTGQSYEPESGTIYLMPTGKAERHVSYPRDGQPPIELVAKGKFEVDGTSLHLALMQENSDIPYTWHVYGTIDGPTLTLSYPGPADGIVTETYRR